LDFRSEATRFKNGKISATILADVRFSDHATQGVMLIESLALLEAIARREKSIANQPIERA